MVYSDNEMVSVVIPTHNRSQLLARAITSVMEQTYQNLEIIVVDDASSDNTSEVVAAFQDKRLRYIRQETNRGGSAARNVGVQAATGTFIAFLDDDDQWDPQKTSEQIKLFDRYMAVLCMYHGEQAGVARRYQSKPTVDLDELQCGFFRGASASALMLRATLAKQAPFDESLPRYQDWDVCIRIAEKCVIGYINRPLVRYNAGDHLRISNKFLSLPASQIEQQARMFRKHRQFFGPKWFRRHMGEMFFYGIRQRSNKAEYLAHVISRFGLRNVIAAGVFRLVRIVVEKYYGLGRWQPDSDRGAEWRAP